MKFPTDTIRSLAQFRDTGKKPDSGTEQRHEYTVDELALASDCSVRNIRAYQDKGLLPPPELRGRKGIYNNQHLSRLRVIANLLERGYTLASIKDLISGLEQGVGLNEILGIESAVNSPWTDEAPTTLPVGELFEMFGDHADDASIELAEKMGMFSIQGDFARVGSMRTLNVALSLLEAGIPLPALLEVTQQSRDNMHNIAQAFVQMVYDHLLSSAEDGSLATLAPTELSGAIDLIWKLRPMAEIVVKAELGRAMDAAASAVLADQLEKIINNAGSVNPAG